MKRRHPQADEVGFGVVLTALWFTGVLAACSAEGAKTTTWEEPGTNLAGARDAGRATTPPATRDAGAAAQGGSGGAAPVGAGGESLDAGAPVGDDAGAPNASPDGPAAADAAAPPAGTLPWPAANAIVAAVHAPVFADARFAITDYGAVADGKTDATLAIAKAIAGCTQAGGGHVVVPAGTFLTGAIALADNVDLHLEDGAILSFSGDVAQYPTVLTRSDGIEVMETAPPISAHGCKNIGITGKGVLDAAATAAWNTDSGAGTQKLQAWGRAGTPVAQRILTGADHVRVAFVEPHGCDGVLISGVTMRNAAYWTLHPTLSQNVLIDGVTIETTVHNADGCDPESSRNVVISNSNFVVADDSVAVKSGRDQDGHRVNAPSENIVVMHSKFRSSYGLLTIGSQESGGVHHVFGYDLETTGPVKYVLWIKSNRERAGDISDIHVDSVRAQKVAAAVVWATLNYEWDNVDNGVPSLDQVSLSQITVDGAPLVLDLEGLANSPIGVFSVTRSTFTNIAKAANSVVNVKSLTFDQVTINGQAAK